MTCRWQNHLTCRWQNLSAELSNYGQSLLVTGRSSNANCRSLAVVVFEFVISLCGITPRKPSAGETVKAAVNGISHPEDADERSAHGGSTPGATSVSVSRTAVVYHGHPIEGEVFEYKQDIPLRNSRSRHLVRVTASM